MPLVPSFTVDRKLMMAPSDAPDTCTSHVYSELTISVGGFVACVILIIGCLASGSGCLFVRFRSCRGRPFSISGFICRCIRGHLFFRYARGMLASVKYGSLYG